MFTFENVPDIRQIIGQLFDRFSYKIVYVRRNRKFKCTCYSERSGEGDPSCPKCFGTGNVVTIETVRTRRRFQTIPETLPGAGKYTSAGTFSIQAYVYYFEAGTNPQMGDLILEVDWDQDKPIGVREKLYISTIQTMQEFEGNPAFYQVYARSNWKGDADDIALSEH
ncbi:hypothetical protein [Alicyclobacillus shizuokensis]|uniref:hypothetical protein n=1 Tax=Alicyclobacillus shizuokensis TaxID=392014 RepID=UPI000833A114|nr:hypothetical protein [Alicyclobacillus shizuokensis]